MSSEMLEQARAKIDAKILQLQERIRCLRSSRNALSLIHGLPHEVMTQIFMWLQIFYRGYARLEDGDYKLLPRWTKVTHVSQHWRNIARSSKALHSTILTHNLKYSKEVLKLSGSAALSLVDSVDYQVSGNLWDTQELQDLVIAALPRVRTLWLNRRSPAFLLPLLEKSTLALEDLSVREWHSCSLKMFPSSLRYLRLTWSSFSYEWLSGLSNMVELSLLAISRQPRIAVDALLNILDGMPRLISLELVSILKPASTQTKRVSPVTPRLQYLQIGDLVDRIVEFIPWLTFSPSFTVDMDPDITTDSINLMQMLFEQVGRHLAASSMVIRTVKDVCDYDDDEDSDDDDEDRAIKVLFSEGAGEDPCCRIGPIPWNQTLAHHWLNPETFPSDNLQSLTIHTLLWRDSPLRHIPALRQLVLPTEKSSLGLLGYLIESAGAEKGRQAGVDTPFESLEELSLHYINYGRDLKSKVQAALTRRMKRGFKLRKLTFHRCNVSEDSIKQLSKVVDVVERHGEKKKKRNRYA
ncbi:hypothetical protein BDN72DRAFT_844416 [Pluteus cervinus]|uniref:Uncharacterized protein n=1 Tax=Pluteus cervinus TaxID=181527 RepID=A0ACD3ALP0_9AGAR|nr:hypothetical protein BDN72DRAFT_844416 [Pluteus cervinus]